MATVPFIRYCFGRDQRQGRLALQLRRGLLGLAWESRRLELNYDDLNYDRRETTIYRYQPRLNSNALLFTVTFVVYALLLASPAANAADGAKPNIVLILSDDEDLKLHAYMPKTKALIEAHGTVFDNFFVSYALCCPSRSTILRGQYAHNHQVEGNEPPEGGYERFHLLGRDQSTIGTWLKAAGYRTAFLGKYLNGYPPEAGVPPGWDEWHATGNAYVGYDYKLNENGKVVSYGKRPEDFVVDVLARKATAIIRDAAKAQQPAFLHISPFTPHSPATPAPRHSHLFADAKLPRSPSFNEADMSDKPAALRAQPLLDAAAIADIEGHYRRRLQSLQSVDDLVESVVKVLDATGQLDNTYIIYASDNGFHMGERRMIAGKDTAYEEDIHVPLSVRGPGVPAGEHLDQMVLNNDLAPTFADMAGATAPAFVDGRSFLSLFKTPNQPWRQSFLVERQQLEVKGDAERVGPIRFNALRTKDWTYIEYGHSDERELYDLKNDPYQLENMYQRADPALVKALSSRLTELDNCAGPECRRVEDLPVAR